MESSEKEAKKCCSICSTTKTPLWRSGPSGPKSLCNACGIKFRKNRPGEVKKGKTGKGKGLKVREGLMKMMMPLGKEGEEQRLPVTRRRSPPNQWGEVERAALLLMALSCGAVFA